MIGAYDEWGNVVDLVEWEEQIRAEALGSIVKGLDEFKDLKRKMTQYFEMVDISSEKTELEKLALDIACNGMQTIGFLIDELSEVDELSKEDKER